MYMRKHTNGVNRRKFLAGGAAASIAAVAGCIGGDGGNGRAGDTNEEGIIEYNGEDPASIVYGAGGSGTLTNTTGSILQSLTNEHSDKVEITPQESAGTEANQRLYSQGQVNFIGTSNWGHRKAASEEDPFGDQPLNKPLPHQGFTYGLTHTYMLARDGSGIEDWSDLEGANVWPLWPGATIRLPFADLLEELGLPETFNSVDVSQTDIAGAMEEGRVDAAAVYGVNFLGLTGWAQELDARQDLHAINMTDEMREQAQNFSGADYTSVEPYGWEQDIGADEVDSVAMNWHLFFGQEIDTELVYEIGSIMHNHLDEARSIYESTIDWSDPELLSTVVMDDFPVHPGAAELYRELDVWDDSWEEGEIGPGPGN